jgi:hypothetical protein
MLFHDFKRIITSFADNSGDLVVSKGHFVVQVRDEVIEGDLVTRDGGLYVVENGDEQTAQGWLVRRVARIHQLAERILMHIEPAAHFVTPAGVLLDEIERDPDEQPIQVPDALESTQAVLARRPPGTTSVLYLTSDAGEGKTTLINQLARSQAALYKDRKTNWLLVPVALGGRSMSRFDDAVIVALVNRLRFPLLYYEAFVELVRLGVIVPAFDGYEEMFVEHGPGEAHSALGNLVDKFDSSGAVLIAARAAYFEYKSFHARTRLFDSIKSDYVSFSRLALQRWSVEQFISYARNRGIPDPETLHKRLADRLDEKHPVLTRAVLVKRLLDIAEDDGLDALLQQLEAAGNDYFHGFVNAIVEREAHEKWTDRSGTPHHPLITVEEHHTLLAMVAEEMWIVNADVLGVDILGLVADQFSEERAKSPAVARQIRERLPQHALFTTVDSRRTRYAFDHEEFRQFYLGDAIARALLAPSDGAVRRLLAIGALPAWTCDVAALYVRRHVGDDAELVPIAYRLVNIGKADTPTSLARENCGALWIRLMDGADHEGVTASNLAFPEGALRGRKLSRVELIACYFEATSLDGASLKFTTFTACRMESLDLTEGMSLESVELRDCNVACLSLPGSERPIFEPAAIEAQLRRAGFTITDAEGRAGATTAQVESQLVELDEDLVALQRALRPFLRATQVSEEFIRRKLSVKANHFFDELLPDLLRTGVLEEVVYHGSGQQRRFRMRASMQDVEKAIAESQGRFDQFVRELSNAS